MDDAFYRDIAKLLGRYGFTAIDSQETGEAISAVFVNSNERVKVEVIVSDASQKDVDLAELR